MSERFEFGEPEGAAKRAGDGVRMPGGAKPPLQAVCQRIGLALSLIVFVALVVRVGRGGYVDVTGSPIGIIDAVYYASVTVTTTGYGDITAVSTGARSATILLITPARILFLILVVGTTVEVLTEQSRRLLLTKRWRQQVNDHYLICGFGATGRSAADDLISRGIPFEKIVVVDSDAEAVAYANRIGLVALHGDAAQRALLDDAGIARARAVIVTPNRDDTAVLITLTSRELNPTVHIVAAGKEHENLHLLRQGGANEVIDATAAVGRMLGMGTYAPGAIEIFDDLLDSSTGLELAEVLPVELNGALETPPGTSLVVAIRNGERLRADQVDKIASGDRLIVLRDSATH